MLKTNCKEDLIICPVCSHIYDKPMKLGCQHTVCGKCIEWTGDSLHKFVCPVCGNTGKDAVRDHGKQALVQMHHKHTTLTVHIGKSTLSPKPVTKLKHRVLTDSSISKVDAENNNTNIGPLKCQLCNEQSKNVEWKCKECETVFCDSCKTAHDGIPNCQTHYVQTINSAAQEIKTTAQEYHFKLSKFERENTKYLDEFLKYRNKMDKTIEDTLGNIDSHQDMCMNIVKEYHNSLRDGVHESKSEYKQHLDTEERQMQNVQGKIKRKRDWLTNLIDTEDSSMVVYLAEQNSKEIETFADNIETMVPSVVKPPTFNIQVDRTGELNVKNIIAVKPDIKFMNMTENGTGSEDSTDSTKSSVASENVWMIDYTELLKRVYKPEKSIPLQYSPRRLCIIDNQIWCAGSAALYIYKKDGTLVKTITHDQIKQVKSITRTQSGDIFVACWDKQGLLHLDQNGHFQGRLAGGSFSDVASCKNLLYALSYQDTTIHQFTQREDGNWEPTREIKLSYNTGHNWDSLYAHVNTIHVCSWANSCIYHYNLMGQVLSQYGTKTSSSSIHFNHPRICESDQFGNLLVVDTDNHKIQVQDGSGNWGYINHTADIKRPIDVVVDDVTSDVWLIQNIPGERHRLHKLVQKPDQIETTI